MIKILKITNSNRAMGKLPMLEDVVNKTIEDNNINENNIINIETRGNCEATIIYRVYT